MRRRRRQLTVAGVLALALWAPAVAGAHARIEPTESLPGEFQLYTLTVPTEREVPTVEVALQVPAGIESVSVEQTPGWTIRLVRKGERVDVVRWVAGSIPPDSFAIFRFIARNPIQEGELVFPVTQRYRGGEVVGWTGPADGETPAPRVLVSESTAGGAGETETTAETTAETEAETTAAPAESDEDDDGGGSTLALVLSIAALLLAVAAVVLAVRRRPA